MHSDKSFSYFFHIEREKSACNRFLEPNRSNTTVVTVILLIMNPTEFRWVYKQRENCHYDHIPFNLKGIIKRFLSECSGKQEQYPIIVWCLTKFMLTTSTDFDTALVMDKNSSMDIVSVCKPHFNTTKFKLPWEFRDVSMLGGLLTFEKKKYVHNVMEIFISDWND